jgi:hypothetical protein
MRVSDGGSGLFLSPVPIPPGDPAALSRGAATYSAATAEIERNRAMLTAAAGQAGGAAWAGTGAAGYMSATSELAVCYGLTAAALASGATALRAYAASLATAKETARRANAAVATANAAASALLNAQQAAADAQTAAVNAAADATTAEAHATANPHSPAAQVAAQSARTAATDAQSASDTAQGRVSTLTAQYDADRAIALRLSSLAQEEARQAAVRAGAGFDAAANELIGKSARPIPGGAHPVTGPSPWQRIITTLAGWNGNRVVGAIASGLGVFGAVLLSRNEYNYLGKLSELADSQVAEDDAFRAFLSGRGSLDDWLTSVDRFSNSLTEHSDALKELQDAVTAGDGGLMDAIGKAGLGVAIVSDIIVIAAPGKSYGPGGLFGGNDDRAMASANLAASGLAIGGDLGIDAATAALAIPGVDVIAGGVLIGTGAYFAGEYVYSHYGHDIAKLGEQAWDDLGTANNWVNNQVDDLGHDVSKVLSWL